MLERLERNANPIAVFLFSTQVVLDTGQALVLVATDVFSTSYSNLQSGCSLSALICRRR